MEERVALLVAPVGMRESAEYLAAFGLAEDRHPNLRIVPDAELWSTAKEFHRTYRKRLSSFVIREVYILTAADGTVGQGIFQMWRYLRKHQGSKITALFPRGDDDGSFEEIEECKLVVVSTDTARYAIPAGRASKAEEEPSPLGLDR